MMMMRRLKSIASGRSSVSDPDGDSGSKRAKVDQGAGGEVPAGPDMGEHKAMDVDLNTEPTHLDVDASDLTGRAEQGGVDQLPKEMHEMAIRDDTAHDQIDKVVETTILKGNGTETGQIIATTIGGRNGQPKQTISYMAKRVVGTGSFGVVFQAKCLETGEPVAIKKVLQDKRYKNRELQVMHLLDHPNVVQLRHYFFSTTEKIEICCALGYIHGDVGVCHRDIKPQNLLVNPQTHQVKLCDFDSAKILVPGEPNISYSCSRSILSTSAAFD